METWLFIHITLITTSPHCITNHLEALHVVVLKSWAKICCKLWSDINLQRVGTYGGNLIEQIIWIVSYKGQSWKWRRTLTSYYKSLGNFFTLKTFIQTSSLCELNHSPSWCILKWNCSRTLSQYPFATWQKNIDIHHLGMGTRHDKM